MTHPTYTPADPCETFECHYRAFRLADCRDRCCPFRFEREAAEGWAARKQKDARAKEAAAIALNKGSENLCSSERR